MPLLPHNVLLKLLIIIFQNNPTIIKQETEKVLALHSQLDQEQTKKSSLLSELSLQSSEVAHLKAREIQLIKEVTNLRETKRKFEEDMVKIKNSHNADIIQVKFILEYMLKNVFYLKF